MKLPNDACGSSKTQPAGISQALITACKFRSLTVSLVVLDLRIGPLDLFIVTFYMKH